MKRRAMANGRSASQLTLMVGLTLALALITAFSHPADARKKITTATGTCECDCNSNEKNADGSPKWTGSGPSGTNVSSAACGANLGKSCVVMSPFGLKNGSYGGCLWTNTSQGSGRIQLGAPPMVNPGVTGPQ